MASQQPMISPPLGTATKTRNRPPTQKKPESRQIETNTRPDKPKVIRPTEIVTPGENRKREQDANQVIDTNDEYEFDNVDSPDGDDGEVIDLSEADEYDDDDYDDDAESVYLSDSEPEDTSSKAVVKAPSQRVRSTSSRNPESASSSSEKNISQPQCTFVETRTQSSQWVVAQQQPFRGVTVTRGASTSRQQTVRQQFQTSNTTNRQERRVSNGNGLRLNMSFNVDVNFSGLVTGRNLSLAGGSLSYAWARDRQS